MTINHKFISDPEIHEPKGVATAVAGRVYLSDGAGSGTWSEVPSTIPSSSGKQKGAPLSANGTGEEEWGALLWKDLVGNITPKTSGAGTPVFTTYRGNIRAFTYASGDTGDVVFHIPHDYALGTDIFLHKHWSHNGTNISGTFTSTFHTTYAKGHNQAAYFSEVDTNITATSLSIANTPQYQTRIEEVQLTAASPSASQFNTSILEPDGLIMIKWDITTVPTITGGSTKPFIHMIDIHYQSNMLGTKNKAPTFYT